MTRLPADYFRYFSATPSARRWGLHLSAAGFGTVPAGSPYPPRPHPADHQFGWERGRVLEGLQVVFIGQGRGTFETRATGLRVVEAGTAFVLLPKVWHRYRPDPTTGWVESWIEVHGPVIENLLRAKVFAPASTLRAITPASGLEAALEAVHLRARTAAPGFDPELSAAALSVLASWDKAARIQPTRSRLTRAVEAAERHFSEHLAEPVNVEALARELGVAYSHFRRVFRAHTGLSPWQYVLHLRLTRARRFLAAGDATLDDIAAQLGFGSGFHLSSSFKRVFGIAPDRWRQRLARSATSGSMPLVEKENPTSGNII